MFPFVPIGGSPILIGGGATEENPTVFCIQ
jgi:hypothetical protein